MKKSVTSELKNDGPLFDETAQKQRAGEEESFGSLDVEGRESPKEEVNPNELKMIFLKARLASMEDPFNQPELCLNLARYLAEPGENDFSSYHKQPMSSSNYPNSKKRSSINEDIYQKNAPRRGDPSLFFLKTDSNSAEIYREYYSTRVLNVFSTIRPLVTAPKVYLTNIPKVEGGKAVRKPYLLSEFVVSNSDRKYLPSEIPMFPYLAAIMMCRKDRDVNPANYLLATEVVVTKHRQENHIPIAVRIDHGSDYEHIHNNPFANKHEVKQPIETLFALTSIFENNEDLDYSDVHWQAYHSHKKINFADSLKKDEQGLLVIKDDLNYFLFMRGICDFIETPREILDMCFPQDSRKMSQRLKSEFIKTQTEVTEFFAKEIERFHNMAKQEPWTSLGTEYTQSIPFDRVIANYQQICEDCGYTDQIQLNNAASARQNEVREKSVKIAPSSSATAVITENLQSGTSLKKDGNLKEFAVSKRW